MTATNPGERLNENAADFVVRCARQYSELATTREQLLEDAFDAIAAAASFLAAGELSPARLASARAAAALSVADVQHGRIEELLALRGATNAPLLGVA